MTITTAQAGQQERSLSEINEIAKVYASSYASPHHIVFTVEGLRAAVSSLSAGTEPDAQLCKFYGVTTFPELVAAMLHHIEKLQTKLPPTPNVFAPQRVREG